MPTYADELRRLAAALDKDFRGNLISAFDSLLALLPRLFDEYLGKVEYSKTDEHSRIPSVHEDEG